MAKSQQYFPWETPPELWRGLKSVPGWQGQVVSIYITPKPSGEMVSVPQVRAFRDRGLEGDRFFRESWNAAKRPDKAVSLIEEEILKIAAREIDEPDFADKSRRNIVTRGVPLIDLLDKEFTIGGVRMRGLRLFEPCPHLVTTSKIPGIFRTLEHRSGLKCAILSDGLIEVGAAIYLQAEIQNAAAQAG
jgi:MOSC domain-containing protein YiiM